MTFRSGEVDLQVTLAEAPSHEEFPPLPPRRRRRSLEGKKGDGCGSSPVSVDIRGASGKTKIHYVGWEEACRTLRQNIVSAVGDVEGESCRSSTLCFAFEGNSLMSISVIGHPNYEGSFRLHTTVGPITVDAPEVEDPTGQGRHRTVSLDKSDRLGSRQWTGQVQWE